MTSRTTKIFTTDSGQAVELPAEFRFEGGEVFVRRDPNLQQISALDQKLTIFVSAVAIMTGRLAAHYFVIKCLVGATVLSGGASEIANVNHVFQPEGRLAASNSP